MTLSANTVKEPGYRSAMVTALLLLVLQGTGFIACILQHLTRPDARYFALTNDQNQVELSALRQPNIDNHALLRWATLAATTAFTLDFVHYQDTLDSLRTYFTTDGFDSLMTAMTQLNYLTDINTRKLYLTAVATEPAVILRRGKVQNQDAWFIGVKLLITIQTGGRPAVRKKNQVVMMVTRVPTRESRSGIGIAQFVQSETAL